MIKFNNIANLIKRNLLETFKLLLAFKWYICSYLLYYTVFVYTLIDIPSVDDPIWNSEAMHGTWNYINQEVYIASMRLYFIIDTLIFLLGISNMRNHPLLAKLIFLSPWIYILLGILVIICKWLVNLF